MRTLIRVAVGVGVLASATPVLAWTVQPAPPSGSSSSQFKDPDNALESAGSSLRDSAVRGGLQAGSGAAFMGGGYVHADDGASNYGFGSVTATSHAYSDGDTFGASGGYDVAPQVYAPPRRR